MLEEDTRVSVYVGPWVLGLALFEEDVGGNLVHVTDQLEHFVVGQVFLGKLALASVAGVGFAEDGVTITGHNLTALQMVPNPVLELLLVVVLTNLADQLLQEDEHFLK